MNSKIAPGFAFEQDLTSAQEGDLADFEQLPAISTSGSVRDYEDTGRLDLKKERNIATSDVSYVEEARGLYSSDQRKAMNREISKRITSDEQESLFLEHHELATRKLTSGLTRKEELRLQMVRWQIDRIEDALIGEQLDRFEAIVADQRHFAAYVERVLNAVKQPKQFSPRAKRK